MGAITAPAGAVPHKERAELQCVLASTAFGRSPRLARLLRYLCDRYFEGQADQIKEYNIAVDVLDRPESFDPSEDAIARVEVHRLRKKLREYYETEGADHAIRIVVPTGHYGPVFLEDSQPASDDETLDSNGSEPEPPEMLPPVPASGAWSVPRFLGFILPTLATLAAVLLIWTRSHSGAASQPDQGATIITSAIATLPGEAVRVLCGQNKPHRDPLGQVWGPDRYFEGGESWERPKTLLARTSDPALFDGARMGSFNYNIPLKRGSYDLHLYFAETSFGPGTSAGGGENSRVFHVALDGKRILSDFDIVSDAGGAAIADERVFKDISPGSDGMLHIRFMSQRSQPMVSAIKLEPSQPHRLNTIRIVTIGKSCLDSRRQTWMPDNYWSGGQPAAAPAEVEGARDGNLYTSERYGNFTYAIPVGDGDYAVTLHFAEKFWGLENPGGGGEGTRVFDVLCNGLALLHDLDVYKEVGGSRPLVKTFHRLKANAQGKLLFSFVPVHNYASLYAIEVTDETPE
jgi:hypothetical protein